MAETPRLNGVIKALEAGKPAFVTFSGASTENAQAIGDAAYDGVVFEMEHGPTTSGRSATACSTCSTASRSSIAVRWRRP